MLLYNLKLAIRNLLSNKVVLLINILGLSVGITIGLLIFSFAQKELSTDHFLRQYEQVFTLLRNDQPGVAKQMSQLVKKEIPEIESITNCHYEQAPQVFVKNNDVSFKIKRLLIADSSFFKVFQLASVYGNPSNSLNKSNQLVLTKSLAKKIFGDTNPIGKSLLYNTTHLQNELVEVTAVIEDLPHNSSWDFEAVLSTLTNYKIDGYRNQGWGNQNFISFLKTKENIDPELLQEKIMNMSQENIPDEYKNLIQFSIFPFSQLYFNFPKHSKLKHGNKFTLAIIQIIGFLILFLACVNYINLVTAQRGKRYKNVAIIKTMGSNKRHILALFTYESAITLLIVLVLVINFVMILLSGFNQLTHSAFSLIEIFTGWNLCMLVFIMLFTLAITGLFPGLIFSRQTTSALINRHVDKKQKNSLRNGLLVFQFFISIILITCLLVINHQNKLLFNNNPGFEKEHILYASTNTDLENNIQAFTNQLLQTPGIDDLTFSSEPILKISENWGLSFINRGKEETISFAKFRVSSNFFNFFTIQLKQGKSFTEHSKAKWDFILNETAIHNFDIKELSDARMLFGKDPSSGTIIGEVEDFNFESMHSPIREAVFTCSGKSDEVIYLKTTANTPEILEQTIHSIKKKWNEFSPNFPFEYHFLDDSWEQLYRKEKQFQKIVSYAALISLFLSCLGLIGLSFFVIENRTKEIGIRKVNGAKTIEIMSMLNLDILKWTLIAFVIACPIAWYAMHKWLENFAYKTELSWWIFAMAGLIAMGIALLTVSFQSWRAATRNPVESLRYE
ncbi:ABC transporter permease [Labilibaculum euxinus]|uniref:FtsX-like permease family protein n=1 Tax=Labilibaculum euxinus TaxID=2686357 RepID=A0A7M4DB08_9BACT|nr:ABC transporter permease [Labilibaculum euxinus]MUP39837.1 FtsX-like permease family protein [Labilibaculum euxinus]MVB09042.1 FtsX-like permease family protein [Labilibaculum euxinus]